MTALKLPDYEDRSDTARANMLSATVSAHQVSLDAPNQPVVLTLVTVQANAPSSSYLFFKRVLDIVLAAVALIVLTPVLTAIAALVKFSSPGPVFFGHDRIGLNGIPFRCWKFRTMVTNADQVFAAHPELHTEFQAAFKIKNDPRVTRFGAILRKMSFDELPQLVNVLFGTMSLIGPRPIVKAEIAKYGEYAPKLFSVKPGIGGLWQASGRSDLDYDSRVALDMEYIDHGSFTYDLALLVRTAGTVIRRRGAY